MSHIKFIKAERESLNKVAVTYFHNEFKQEFKVFWSNVHQTELNKTYQYYLKADCLSESLCLRDLVINEIKEGETQYDDCKLYLELRDTFDRLDSESLEYSLDLFKHTETQVYWYDDEYENHIRYNINFIINDCFIIQFDSVNELFTIPSGVEVFWNDKHMQNIAHQYFEVDDIAEHLKLGTDPKSLINLPIDAIRRVQVY